MNEYEKTHYVGCSNVAEEILSVIHDPNGNAMTFGDLCTFINALQDDLLTLKGTLDNIVSERDEFEGPSLDYMQGYRDGQEHLQAIARNGLGSNKC